MTRAAGPSRRQIKEQAVRKGISEAVRKETTVRGLLSACLDVYGEYRMINELAKKTGISQATILRTRKHGEATTYTADVLLRAMGVSIGGTYGTI